MSIQRLLSWLFPRLVILTLGALLPFTAAAQYDTVYEGRVDNNQVLAISIDEIPSKPETAELVDLIGQNSGTLILYHRYQSVSITEPIAVFRNGEIQNYNSEPSRLTSGSSISTEISNAYVQGGRTGAVCEDGWRSDATGRGACSHHGGVDYWTHGRIKNRDATVAAICNDYRLVSGSGNNCRDAGVLAPVKNRSY